MRAAEEETRQQGMQCARIGMYQESELGEQEAERDQPEAGFVGQAGPGFLGLAGCDLVQHSSLFNIDLPTDHHPVVV